MSKDSISNINVVVVPKINFFETTAVHSNFLNDYSDYGGDEEMRLGNI